jgi:predicted transporter
MALLLLAPTVFAARNWGEIASCAISLGCMVVCLPCKLGCWHQGPLIGFLELV